MLSHLFPIQTSFPFSTMPSAAIRNHSQSQFLGYLLFVPISLMNRGETPEQMRMTYFSVPASPAFAFPGGETCSGPLIGSSFRLGMTKLVFIARVKPCSAPIRKGSMKCKYICLLLSPLLLHYRITGYQETQDIFPRSARPASSPASILEQELISFRELYFSFSYFQLQTCGLHYWPCELQPPAAMGAFSSLRESLYAAIADIHSH